MSHAEGLSGKPRNFHHRLRGMCQGFEKFSMHSFGAHFCEVAYDPGIARLRVSRWLTVIDGGRMINLKTSRNQILGSVVTGIGMATLEETVYDPRNGTH
jgi:xanthine dehydrogenase YagR molybdenum-binding subunit